MPIPVEELQKAGIDPRLTDPWGLTDRQFRRLIYLCAIHDDILYGEHVRMRAKERRAGFDEIKKCLIYGTQWGATSTGKLGDRVINLTRLSCGEQIRVTVTAKSVTGHGLVMTVAWIS